ncbi:hypothetical protein Dsin_008809 [Dipteronia sinensis]|uniref:Uncharacterized protein n=1 Tax=Dipteronia sinensis TaxID=43782 RepID=A0AAE0EBA8_9ROSI|nr:hypothetical protein Dsin_008809 [Dipteronia sinensis]
MKRYVEVERLVFEHKEIISKMEIREQEYIEEIEIAKQAIKDLVNGSINMNSSMDLAQPLGESSNLKRNEKLVIASPPSKKAKVKKSPKNNPPKAKGHSSPIRCTLALCTAGEQLFLGSMSSLPFSGNFQVSRCTHVVRTAGCFSIIGRSSSHFVIFAYRAQLRESHKLIGWREYDR